MTVARLALAVAPILGVPACVKGVKQHRHHTHKPGLLSHLFCCFVSLFLVPEGSLAGFFVRRHLALELVCGADFSWELMCGAGPGDLGGSRGSDSAKNSPRAPPDTACLGKNCFQQTFSHPLPLPSGHSPLTAKTYAKTIPKTRSPVKHSTPA